jgi:hypothetical protein
MAHNRANPGAAYRPLMPPVTAPTAAPVLAPVFG